MHTGIWTLCENFTSIGKDKLELQASEILTQCNGWPNGLGLFPEKSAEKDSFWALAPKRWPLAEKWPDKHCSPWSELSFISKTGDLIRQGAPARALKGSFSPITDRNFCALAPKRYTLAKKCSEQTLTSLVQAIVWHSYRSAKSTTEVAGAREMSDFATGHARK